MVNLCNYECEGPEDDVSVQGSDRPVWRHVAEVPEHHLPRHHGEGQGPNLQWYRSGILQSHIVMAQEP
jgi:hypothetical protein